MAGSTPFKTRPNKKQKSGKQSQTQKQSTCTKLKNKATIQNQNPVHFGSVSDSEPETDVKSLLEAYTKPQLVDFLLDAAISDPELQTRIKSIADSGTTFRKIFVYGLSWDTTKVCLAEAFSKYGEIEDCHVVLDKQTNRAKGFGFVMFKTRFGASKALKEPQKMVNNRYVSCQLACLGKNESSGNNTVASSSNITSYDYGRKIYVAPVEGEMKPEKLKEFFEKFGEIETGPIGFDLATGKAKGYAMFVYKDKDGANNALQEPYKIFEGIQLHCKLANPSRPTEAVQQPAPGHLEASALPVAPQSNVLAAAQNLALLAQSPIYAALLANPLLAAAALNPASANYAALGGMLGYGGSGVAAGTGYGDGALGARYGGAAAAAEVGYGGGAAATARLGYDGGGAGVSGLYGGIGLQGYQGGMSSSQGAPAGTNRNVGGGALGGHPSSFI